MSLPQFIQDRIAADIRQQMDGVLALADQLSRQRLTADAQACLTGVAEAALGVRRLMDSALDLRSATGDGVVLEPAPLRLLDLIDEIHARWQARAAQAGVTLLVSYDGDPGACVETDRTRLLQVFDGFVGVAMGRARQGAIEVGLRATRQGSRMAIEGRVRGARNLAWNDLELETRVREIDSRFGLDVALGVMLARQLLTAFAGELHAEKAGGDETSVFSLVLPMAAVAPVERAGPSRSIHVLVVDDNATNRIVAQALLEMFDCTCESASDGVEAVEAAQTGRFDLILMDIKMPRLDGLGATRQIRALDGPIGKTPIIALTANADADDAAAYRAAGMNGLVEKPMKPETLLAAIHQAVQEPNAAAA